MLSSLWLSEFGRFLSRGHATTKFVRRRSGDTFRAARAAAMTNVCFRGVIRQWRQLGFRLFVMANTSRWRNRPILNTTKHAFEGGIHDRL